MNFMSYDDEWFYEPDEYEKQLSVFDTQIEEFKQGLIDSVKAEYKEELARLQQENDELQKVKRDWEKIQTEYAAKCRQLEYDKSLLERKVRSARLGELMKDLNVTLYQVGYEYVKRPKCSNCNENREYEFTSPTGKALKEQCDCAGSYRILVPEELIMSEMRSRDGKITAWYKKYRDSDEGLELSSSTVATKIFEPGTPFEKIESRRGTFFRSKDDCQSYCDWLNDARNGSI